MPANGKTIFNQYDFSSSTSDLDSDNIREIKEDSQVKSKFDIRVENALDFPVIWNVEDVKEDITTYIQSYFEEDNINSLDWEQFARYVLSALEFGYSVTELVWEKEEDKQRLKEFGSVSVDNAEFDSKGNLVNSHTGKVIEEYLKFIVYKNYVDFDNIDGRTIYTKSIYNWVIFKKRVVVLLDQLLDKFGVPSVIVLLENITTDPIKAQEITDAISKDIESIRSGAGVSLANVKSLETLEAKGNAGDFEKAKAIADEEIAKIILGTGVTTDAPAKGSYSNNTTSEYVTFRKAKSDNKIIQTPINKVIRWLVDNRYGTEEKAPYYSYDRKDGFIFDNIIKGIQNGIEDISASETYKFIPKSKDEADKLILKEVQQPTFAEKKKLKLKII